LICNQTCLISVCLKSEVTGSTPVPTTTDDQPFGLVIGRFGRFAFQRG
jgi:hypothetical protein